MRTDCDGFLGAVLAAEGTEGYRALINGPGGCRSRTQILAQEQFPESEGDSMGCCCSEFMSRQSRVPCTFLNNDDIVFGSADKIADGIGSVIKATGDDVVLIETLGASVQVADRRSAANRSGFGDRTVLADPDVSSLSFCQGFDDTMMKIVEAIGPVKVESDGCRVNILGYGAFDADWTFGKEAIRSMLSLMGIEVVSFVGLDSRKILERSGSADFNIMIHPECCRKTAEWYSENLGIPFIEPTMGAPIGILSIRRFLNEVSEVTGKDADVPMRMVDEEEQRLYALLRNYDKFAGGMRGYGMAFEGMPSDILPVMEWMYELFSMVPESIRIRRTSEPAESEAIMEFLRSIGCPEAMGALLPTDGIKAVFTDGLTAERLKFEDPRRACVGFEMPFKGVRGITDRSLMWLNGCRILVDEVINGQGTFKCGQPTPVDFR